MERDLESRGTGSGRYRFITYKAGTKEILRTSQWIKNKISLADGHGFNILARRLSGNTAYDLVVTQAKIGTGTNTPAITDTDLQTPVLSGIAVANSAYAGGVATLEFFMADGALSNGTYNEFGIFCGSQLFGRSLISPAHTKAAGEDTACEYELTFANL